MSLEKVLTIPSRQSGSQVGELYEDLTTPFDPSIEETEEFRFTAPKVVNSYREKHFRRTLSKEERTAMLRVHPKPDTPVASQPKLPVHDGFCREKV